MCVCVCVHAWGGGGYLLMLVAEIRYRHDLVFVSQVLFLSFSDENPTY